MMDYSHFEVEDFASDDYFIRWVFDNDPDAAFFWESYQLSHPEAKGKIEKARSLLLGIQKAEPTYYVAGQVHKSWENIQQRIGRPPVKRSLSLLRIAASVSVIAILSLLWYRFDGSYISLSETTAKTAGIDQNLVERVNTTGQTLTIHLGDGSVVRLENNSILKYYENYRDEPYRKVYLAGEAFFDIAKNPRQPFLVYSNEVVTKVLGTSFRVKAYDGEESVVVSVKEGKVSVYSAKSQVTDRDPIESEVNGVVLMPNQQVRYERSEDSFNKTLVESPQIIKEEAKQLNFEFRSTPAEEVLAVLSGAYGVEIIFDADALKNCYLTVSLGNEPLFEKLKIVCRTIGATYELIDANIIVSSKGCTAEGAGN